MRLNLSGLIPLLAGTYFLLLALGVVRGGKPGPELEHWRQRFAGPLKVLSPLVILFGLLQLFGLL